MYAPEERKAMLVAMRKDILDRLEDAQADLDAVDRLISVQTEISPPVQTAKVEEVRQTAVEVLNEHGDAMHRRDILDKLTELGVHVGGKVPINTLGSVLSRFGEDFEPLGQGVWGLKSWQARSSQNGVRVPLVEVTEERRTLGEALVSELNAGTYGSELRSEDEGQGLPA